MDLGALSLGEIELLASFSLERVEMSLKHIISLIGPPWGLFGTHGGPKRVHLDLGPSPLG